MFILFRGCKRLVYAFILFSLVSCGERDYFVNNDGDNGDDSISYSEENVFLEKKDISLVISRTDEGKVQFSDKTPLNIIPKVGKILALPIDEQYPAGYYGKVKEITNRDGVYEVQLEPATIAELYPDTVLYYKGPVYAMASSRAGDDIIFDIGLNYGVVGITGLYSMVSPEVEYKVETRDGKEIGRTFRITSVVKTETKFSLEGKAIDYESEPIVSVYLVGHKFSDYFGLGVKADFNWRAVGEIDFDASLTHTMYGNLDVGFSVGEHIGDSVSSIINDFDVVINEFEWSKFEKAKGEIGLGISLKAYTDVNFLKWKFSTDDNLFLRVAALVNFKSDFDYMNFNYKDVNNEIEIGHKFIVDYKAGFCKEDDDGNEIFLGWNDSAQWYKKWGEFLIWPEFEITDHNYWGTSAMLGVLEIKSEAILFMCDKALVWYDIETKKMCGVQYFSFNSNYESVMIEGLDAEKHYLVYPAIKVGDNQFLRIGEPYQIGPYNLDLPDYDWIIP